MVKTIASAVLAAGLLIGMFAEADAAVCARGPYRAGCAGPHGAVVAPRGGYARPVYGRPVYGPHCYWRAGVRVCR